MYTRANHFWGSNLHKHASKDSRTKPHCTRVEQSHDHCWYRISNHDFRGSFLVSRWNVPCSFRYSGWDSRALARAAFLPKLDRRSKAFIEEQTSKLRLTRNKTFNSCAPLYNLALAADSLSLRLKSSLACEGISIQEGV